MEEGGELADPHPEVRVKGWGWSRRFNLWHFFANPEKPGWGLTACGHYRFFDRGLVERVPIEHTECEECADQVFANESTRTYAVTLRDVIDLDGHATARYTPAKLREVLIENLLDKWSRMTLAELAWHLIDEVELIEEREE